tara:strand:- start:388 stop:507 length:120 start_codon:yes stop_codon:yes gene_type:complete
MFISDDESVNYSDEDAMDAKIPTRKKSVKKNGKLGNLNR